MAWGYGVLLAAVSGVAVFGADGEPLGARPLLALGGADAVALAKGDGPPTAGKPDLFYLYDGQVYRFGTAAGRDAFLADPPRYAPALAGFSVAAWRDRRTLVAGRPEVRTVHNGRTFLFATPAEREAFRAAPATCADADLLLAGRSPVSLVDREVSQPGKGEFQVVAEGRRVLLTDARERDKFVGNLGRYFPVLAGVDVVRWVDGKTAAEGDARHAVVYKNRLFVFAGRDTLERFAAAPARYADADVAAGGRCPVTAVEEKRPAAGKALVGTVFGGRRYLFADEAKRRRFLAEPLKYLPAPGS